MERQMSDQPHTGNNLRIKGLPSGQSRSFALVPDAAARVALAAELGIASVRKLRFTGAVFPEGTADWRLVAKLGATVVQDCVTTLAPVTTRIDVPVNRTYLADLAPLPDEDEIEMPDDDSVEPLPDTLDLSAVMAEALALALPEYPHAEGVTPLVQTYTEPGEQAMSDADAKPFAGLASLRDKLGRDDEA